MNCYPNLVSLLFAVPISHYILNVFHYLVISFFSHSQMFELEVIQLIRMNNLYFKK